MAVDWTELPPELIESIAKKLTVYVDYIYFRSICKTWRSSLPKIPFHLAPQLPWLMLTHSRFSQSHSSFFDLSSNKVHTIYLPEASNGRRRCGSSFGWLVFLDETPSILLLNPLTRSRLQLPSLSTFPNVVSFNYSEIGREYSLRSSFGDLFYTRNLRQMRDFFIKKVVFSSSPLNAHGFIALAILNQTGDLAFCRSGDQSWNFIDVVRSFSEDAVYFNGVFYAVNKFGAVAVCDVRGSVSSVSIVETGRDVDAGGADMQYLVQSGDDLLLVSRYLDIDHDYGEDSSNAIYKTVAFDVFRMNWDEPRWERVSNLGDRALFIGKSSSLSIAASDFPGCEGNAIYFTDDYSEFDNMFGEHDSGIFRLHDATVEWKWNSYCTVHLPPPFWVTPNPC